MSLRPSRREAFPVTLGAKWNVRVGDLCAWHKLQIKCFQCDSKAWLYPDKLKGRYPDYSKLIDLERKFRCTKCGNVHCNSWQVYQLPRD